MTTRVLVPLAVSRDDPPLGWVVRDLAGLSMGTRWSMRLVLPREADLGGWHRLVQARLDEVVAQMSHWEASSYLGRFNRAPAGSRHALPQPFFDVLRYGVSVAQDSGGAFDPAAGALVNAWGFGPGPRYDDPGFEPPPSSAATTAVPTSPWPEASPGWQQLALDNTTCQATQPGGVLLDLSSVAKGFAVDHVSRALVQAGLRHHLVEVGGELRGTGLKPDGQPWWVALEEAHDDPDQRGLAGAADLRVALHGLSVATSGDYRRYFMAEGKRHAHTLDPRSGRPVAHGLASATVVHQDCMAADALSTVLLVLGADEGLAWAEARSVAARLLSRDDASPTGFTEHMTSAMTEMLQ